MYTNLPHINDNTKAFCSEIIVKCHPMIINEFCYSIVEFN